MSSTILEFVSNIVMRQTAIKLFVTFSGLNKLDCGPFPLIQKVKEVLGNLATIGTKRLVVCENNKRVTVTCLASAKWSHGELTCLGLLNN
ncbi:hypothetical protein DPMN_007085 [Dreissena polymorpha]|uniref:Uncharacterized protein n=1 Tax=Dreissena polymorpha TaxID=45954 RepID=A0A9D4MVV4_DREPO|nr:hypothetical protein DPMN_007085 [Dreissena polymorpha]